MPLLGGPLGEFLRSVTAHPSACMDTCVDMLCGLFGVGIGHRFVHIPSLYGLSNALVNINITLHSFTQISNLVS